LKIETMSDEPLMETVSYDDGESRAGADLRRRAFDFAKLSIAVHRHVVATDASMREVARQFIRAATSFGANLEEAEAAQSRADFISKCNISLKEAREARYWARLLHDTVRGIDQSPINAVLKESREFVAILTTIVRRSRSRSSEIRDGVEDPWTA
jgi:four helix bundle protein